MDDRDYMTKLYEFTGRQRSRRRVDFLLRAYSWMGLMLAVVGGGYFLFTLLSFDLSAQQRFALILAGAGALVALMSRLFIAFYKERDAEELDRTEEYERLDSFLSAWQQFERVSKEILEKEGRRLNMHSLRVVISYLHDEGKIDEEDVLVLEEGLKTRNLIVHGERRVPRRMTERVTESLVEVIQKIES